jgi:hypothetical protein
MEITPPMIIRLCHHLHQLSFIVMQEEDSVKKGQQALSWIQQRSRVRLNLP